MKLGLNIIEPLNWTFSYSKFTAYVITRPWLVFNNWVGHSVGIEKPLLPTPPASLSVRFQLISWPDNEYMNKYKVGFVTSSSAKCLYRDKKTAAIITKCFFLPNFVWSQNRCFHFKIHSWILDHPLTNLKLQHDVMNIFLSSDNKRTNIKL